ncbi:hypothetical protein HYC85_016488 [Camellia sinensis]|uniref:MORF/ORRM1/DAG-like MORF domain-containing protein n=1 Tax=Camellia sinensis TaxID=4442 RepID=A0A7J7H002_CAMSI|nr:hypothetical protein HYC85_016488 [Camellia sinensis]
MCVLKVSEDMPPSEKCLCFLGYVSSNQDLRVKDLQPYLRLISDSQLELAPPTLFCFFFPHLCSEEEAKKSIYSVSTKYYYAFGCKIPENLTHKIKCNLPLVPFHLNIYFAFSISSLSNTPVFVCSFAQCEMGSTRFLFMSQ